MGSLSFGKRQSDLIAGLIRLNYNLHLCEDEVVRGLASVNVSNIDLVVIASSPPYGGFSTVE